MTSSPMRLDRFAVDATNSEELYSALSAINISVPGRVVGRKTHHTEIWMIARLLAILGKAGWLSYPLSACHRDRPDILLTSAGFKIGIEITEAVGAQYAEFLALAEREFPGSIIDPGHFKPGGAKLSVDDMRAILRQNKLTSDGWAGDGPEQEWALNIQNLLLNKMDKFRNAEFVKYPHNWLVVYDNLPLPNIHLQKAVPLLRSRIQDYWGQVPSFDALIIEHGSVIVAITATDTEQLALNNLWN